jgi:ankyrin repeat protein
MIILHNPEGTTDCDHSKGCGMWVQRVEELVDQDVIPVVQSTPTPKASFSGVTLDSPSPQLTPSKLIRVPTAMKRRLDNTEHDENIRIFKRVRLMHHKHQMFRGITNDADTIPQNYPSGVQCNGRVFGYIEDSLSYEHDSERQLEEYLATNLSLAPSSLQLASLHGDINAVRDILSLGEDINAYGCWIYEKHEKRLSITALHASIQGRHIRIAELLLASGADPNINTTNWDTPLVMAVRKKDIKFVRLLLRHGADVNQISVYPYSPWTGITALQRACCQGDTQIASVLLDHGANVNIKRGNFGPALVAATMNHELSLVERLLDAGADINRGHLVGPPNNLFQQTALARAITINCIPVVKLLLERGAEIYISCECGNAVQTAAFFGRDEILDYLVSKGADIHRCSKRFNSALEAAVAGSQETMFKKLLSYGIDIDRPCVDLGNLLQVAASSGSNSIIQLLLDERMDVNIQGGYHGSALTAAANHGHASTCRMLIERGANLDTRGGKGSGALHAAVEGGHLEIVKLLLDSGAPINCTGGKYGSLLQVAALNTPEPIALLLLERGIDVNIQVGHFGNALQAWSYVGNAKIVELLIRKGADVKARGGAYETALIGAVAGGNVLTAKALLDAGSEFFPKSPMYGDVFECAERLKTQIPEDYDRMMRVLTASAKV